MQDIAHLHDSHSVIESGLVLSFLGYSHSGFKQNFHRTFTHVVMAIERFPGLLVHLIHHQSGILVEQIDEALEHVQMEGRSDEFAMLAPFVTCAD